MLKHKAKCCTCGARRFIVQIEHDSLWQCPSCIRLDARLRLKEPLFVETGKFVITDEMRTQNILSIVGGGGGGKPLITEADVEWLAALGVKW